MKPLRRRVYTDLPIAVHAGPTVVHLSTVIVDDAEDPPSTADVDRAVTFTVYAAGFEGPLEIEYDEAGAIVYAFPRVEDVTS